MLVMVGWKSSFMASCVSRSIPWDDHFTMLMLKHDEDGKRHNHGRPSDIVMSYLFFLTSFYLRMHRFVMFPSIIVRKSKRKHGRLTCSS